MTTATLVTHGRTMDMNTDAARPRRSLEELVDRLFAAMGFGAETAEPSVAQTIHEARRLRQTGNIDDALGTLANMDVAKATPPEARWAFSEWKDLVKRRFAGKELLLYSQGVGRAAALVPNDGDGMTLEVVAVLGMRWRPGKTVSRRSLRGLRPPVSSTGQALTESAP